MRSLIDLIKKEKLGTYKENVSFKKLTTYKTGGTARLVVFPSSISSLIRILKYIKNNNIDYKVFGNGSNILASDKSYDGVIIKLTNLNNIIINDNKIEVEAGYNFTNLCNQMSKKGYTGLEFGGGIPATVGGAIYMNAGAYLESISSVVEKVEILDENLKVITITKGEIKYGYRSSIFMKKNWIILKAYLKLKKYKKEEIIDLIEDRKRRRINTQPLEYPSAGSVFRNPKGMFAGKLIEDCNLKGYTYGGAQISDKHANFIINKNNATSNDIAYLMNLATEKVKEKYNVELHREQELFNFGDE